MIRDRNLKTWFYHCCLNRNEKKTVLHISTGGFNIYSALRSSSVPLSFSNKIFTITKSLLGWHQLLKKGIQTIKFRFHILDSDNESLRAVWAFGPNRKIRFFCLSFSMLSKLFLLIRRRLQRWKTSRCVALYDNDDVISQGEANLSEWDNFTVN